MPQGRFVLQASGETSPRGFTWTPDTSVFSRTLSRAELLRQLKESLLKLILTAKALMAFACVFYCSGLSVIQRSFSLNVITNFSKNSARPMMSGWFVACLSRIITGISRLNALCSPFPLVWMFILVFHAFTLPPMPRHSVASHLLKSIPSISAWSLNITEKSAPESSNAALSKLFTPK